MATDKQPRNDAAKRTTRSATRVPTSPKPVSSAQTIDGTARNAVLEGNSSYDLEEVRKRAYELYEQDGRQDGRHEEHWMRAENEVRARNGGNKQKKSA